MLRQYLVLVLLALLTTCCAASHVPTAPPPPYEPRAVLDLVADVDFTEVERGWVQEAAMELAIQTNGLVRVRAIFALDFHDDASLLGAVGSDILVKVDREAGPVVAFDTKHCCLLGLTHKDGDDHYTVYIVSDRIEQVAGFHEPTTHTLFVSTTMHEMLHALGLNHVAEPHALMASNVSGGVTTHLGRADYVELCRVWYCSVRRASAGRFE